MKLGFFKADLWISRARTAWVLLKYRFLDSSPFMNSSLGEGNQNLQFLVDATGDCGSVGI